MIADRVRLSQVATITAPDDFAGWRDKARALLAANIAPDQIIWEVADTATPDLFASGSDVTPQAAIDCNLVLSREFLTLLRHALMHSEPARFALAYRLLWRMRASPRLHQDPADPDVIALRSLAKAVRRDIHKMHAFVRFRKVGEAEGREQFAAWFEPDHHIVHAVGGFFRDRFTGMDWRIVTPAASIGWDGTSLRKGPGGTRAEVPGEDAVASEWCAYYANIFNPARLKINAMKREMPVRYWRNLPEATLISDLVQDAAKRVETMVDETRDKADLFGADAMAPAENVRHFDSLASLYAALAREDAPPSPGFSDHVVPGEGAPNASVMFVGEQPGDQEDLAGRPFVGPAGQLLDQCLDEAGMSRDQAFLTNAVKRFKFAPRGKRRIHQTPTAGDIAHYRWWLAEEIRLVNPRIVVALGATALHALSGRKQALNPIRGMAQPWNDRCMLVTVHPSYLLRLPDAQARDIERGKFIRDLRKAVQI
jgi:DNA polymerase